MSVTPDDSLTKGGRRGGRAERLAPRAQPLAEHLRPIRPGLAGGRYQPLTEAEVQRIHQAALDALEVIGLSQAPSSGIEAMTKAGAAKCNGARVRLSATLTVLSFRRCALPKKAV